ncbi:sigma-54 dependent transcriptional regulator [Desulforapulum autotrophicum HRM2]|uniref:Sigma-54 dependent transcriptional regulator n=1 Tax=Desulforapulum autotrophicum (strain ATCC 43914 / DSM 3382 / VKM B-1955 / HRM2) TaxID=177437 RepID=C0QL16_DESAH|nr:sigma-54-dependent Fis family transcriptional regulator [Desulforapulum autotrophicum]ACN14102.1 sigma-54 dependent transcriptional regulator [Desulforapulum autotrophicum HRM2]
MLEQVIDQYWKTVVDTIQEGVMIVNKNGRIVFVNGSFEKITGYSRQEAQGKSCHLLQCDTCEKARCLTGENWCDLFKVGCIDMKRCTLTHKNKGRVQVLKNASLLKDALGNVVGAVETLTDISDIVEKDHQIEAFRRQLQQENGFHNLLGTSRAMHQVFELIRNAARSDAPVLIQGESGTGKELVAQCIHDIGPRLEQPFVKVNCAALNESILESELFGHVKGAFTGAVKDRKGRFEAAKDGDLFLDEIGDLPFYCQVKLLRVLEENIIERVGDNTPTPVNTRIITATNRSLKEDVRTGKFREDLFYRINVIPIQIPPLRERAEDIPVLVDSFLLRNRLKTQSAIQGVSNRAMQSLMAYPWPGNVRELKSAFEYAFVTCHGTVIRREHLPLQVFLSGTSSPTTDNQLPHKDETQKQQLLRALDQSGGNQSMAARMLGVSRVTVWNRMKKYDIDLNRKERVGEAK